MVSVCAVRTGCGKSQTARRVIEVLMGRGLKVVAVRHPMPYGDLAAQRVQRFAALEDLERHHCTIEEMEEYEPHVVRGNVIYAGVDYEAILRAAEADPRGCDVIVWDGGNNDFSFYRPDLAITVVDPHRPGHEIGYYPGEVNLRTADVVVINKIDSADAAGVATVGPTSPAVNPAAAVVVGQLGGAAGRPLRRRRQARAGGRGRAHPHPRRHEDRGRDGGRPALRRGGPGRPPALPGRPTAGDLRHLPGHRHPAPRHGLRRRAAGRPGGHHRRHPADAVVIGTPIDLARVIRIDRPQTRVYYDLDEIGTPHLAGLLGGFLTRRGMG